MIRNYFKIAWRNLWKNRTFSLINIIGLSIGIAFILIASAYIGSELNVNAQLTDNEQVYIVQSKWKDPNMGIDFGTLAPLVKSLKDNFPELVTDYYHHDGINSVVSHGDKHFNERLQIGDHSFFNMFGFPLLYGDPGTAFNNPSSMVITASKAMKYFGRKDVVGETLTIMSFSGGKQDFQITGVLKDPTYNTIMSYGVGTDEFFLPVESLRFFGREDAIRDWNNPYIISYVRLKKGVKPEVLQKPVQQLLKLNASVDVQNNLSVYFTPVKDYYLKSNNGLAYRMIYALAFVSLFILIMAVLNFVNITIGNSVYRLREIGVRKVMGSSKTQLIMQFLAESTLVTAFSVLVSLGMYIYTRQFFSNMLGRELPKIIDNPTLLILSPIAFIFFIGILAGLYPSFILSRQDTIASLKGKMETVKEKVLLRRSLITLQFITAVVVFVGAIVINNQVKYFFKADLGYNKDRIVTVRVPRDWTPKGVQHMATLRDQFLTMSEVANASFSYDIPDGGSAGNTTLYRQGQESSKGINAESFITDEKYIDTYHIPLLAGTFFNNKGGVLDSNGIVLNKTAVKALGWSNSQDAIGQKLNIDGGTKPLTIIGVINDYHFGPFQQRISPVFFTHVQNGLLYRFMSFKLYEGNLTTTMAGLQRKWAELLPDAPFDFKFIDETLNKLYESELQMKKASDTATAIALVIVVLGVLGIVTQSITKRTREIGVRKVLGASVLQIILLFAKEFFVMLLVANCIAWPIAWFMLNKWLNNYAYRIELSLFPFIEVSCILLIAVAAIIASKTIRTALASPTKSLRTE